MPKKKSKQAPKPQAPMTRREATRWQKEKSQERATLLFVVTTIVLVVGILLSGMWREIWSRPGQVVARVGSTSITLGALSEDIAYRAKTLDRQILLTNAQVRQGKVQAQSDPTSSFLVQYLEQQLQQLQMERLQLGSGQGVLEDLIQREIIRQEVLKRGGNVTAADIEAEIQREFQPQADSAAASATSSVTDTTTLTETVALTPTPTLTPIPADAWKARYQETLTTYNISEADFRRFTMAPSVWRARLVEYIAATVATTTEQVHAYHILLATEAEAMQTLALAQQAGASFEDIARERSTDTSNKDEGGDLGWFPRGVMAAEFEEAAFTLQPGQISGIISTTFGFHVIKVAEKDANHPLSADQLDQRKSQAFSDWLTTASASPDVQRYFDSDKQAWLNKRIPTAQF